nr:14685_t:CDS:2 [Entrophospora candida]
MSPSLQSSSINDDNPSNESYLSSSPSALPSNEIHNHDTRLELPKEPLHNHDTQSESPKGQLDNNDTKSTNELLSNDSLESFSPQQTNNNNQELPVSEPNNEPKSKSPTVNNNGNKSDCDCGKRRMDAIEDNYEEQVGDATTLIQNINGQRDDVDNLIDRLSFSSALAAEKYISIDDEEINEMPSKKEILEQIGGENVIVVIVIVIGGWSLRSVETRFDRTLGENPI